MDMYQKRKMRAAKKNNYSQDSFTSVRINWYPGHMAKTKRLISENLKLVDAVVEILDARIPLSSQNPEINQLCRDKKRLIILNKQDMANEEVTKKWINYFKNKGFSAICANCESGDGLKKVPSELKSLLSEKLEHDKERGIKKPMRIMVAGIPNSGKSSFINRMAKRQALKTENRPGVTVSKQWVKVSEEIELLDTPGILWPKLDNEKCALHLAFTGAIKDQIMDIEGVCVRFLEFMLENYHSVLEERYKITITDDDDRLSVYDKICYKRGYIFKKDDPDYTRCARAVLDDFRTVKLGRISVEDPDVIFE